MKIILDLDTGIDDALAIAYTLAKREEAKLLGITSIFGNTNLKNATQNALDILNLFSKQQIPVYIGAESKNSIEKFEQNQSGFLFHGANGIGNVILPKSVTKANFGASRFLIDMAKKYKKELKIVATGPLTNIAKAIMEDRDAMLGIDELVVMGGALTVKGNISPFFAEANFFQDAESADMVLSSGLSITLVLLDVTKRVQLRRADTKEWDSFGEKGKKIRAILEHYFKAHELTYGKEECALHDPLAVGVAIYPNLIKTIPLCLKVVASGVEYGRVLKDANVTKKAKVKVAVDVNVQEFKKDFLNSMQRILRE